MAKRSIEKFKIYKNVFDEFTLQTLFKLSTRGHFNDLVSPIRIGKESNVFLAESEEGYVIVKVYRLQSCNFNKMYSYIKSDPRFVNIKNQRRLVIFRWVQREYKNLLLAREVINVPTPIAFLNNVLVMESIGEERPASQLKDKMPLDINDFCSRIVESNRKMLARGLVHGDLSEFNILNHQERPYFIDFSQATSSQDPNVQEYIKRDIENLSRYFQKIGYAFDKAQELAKLSSLKKEIIK